MKLSENFIKISRFYILIPKDKRILGFTIVKIRKGFRSFYSKYLETGSIKDMLPGGEFFLGYNLKDIKKKYGI